jgi:hypothetical protein
MPRRAPEGLDGSARRGAAGMPLVFGGLGIALPKTPFKPFGAQDTSGMGWLFLWILSFGQTKESIAAVGPRPDIKNNRRVSDTNQEAPPCN